MRIGFDAKRAFMNASGLGNYSRTLMKSLLDHFPEHEYTAFTPGMKDDLGKELLASPKLKVSMPPPLMRGILASWWRSSLVSEAVRSQNLDVYHGLSNEIPKRLPFSVKKIVTIHDLIFLRHPEWYPFIDRNIYYKKFRYACKQADVVVAVSEQTRQDVIYYFNIPGEKIKVVYQGYGFRFASPVTGPQQESFWSRYRLPAKYMLCVGSIEERKNLLVLLRALTKIREIHLVVIGKKTKYFKEVISFIRENKIEDRVIFPEKVDDGDLVQFYRNACVFVYPSRYEGFGIPVIEALSCGVPVITSSVSALPEAGGPGSVYFNPDDPDELAQKIGLVLNDAILCDRMIREGYEHLKKFDPKNAAAMMMSIYSGTKQS